MTIMPRPAPAADTRLTAALQSAVADELRHVRDHLEKLAMLLVSDPYFIEHYCEELQSFDLLVQYADETAAVLDRLAQGSCSHSAIAPVRLGVVHQRLVDQLAAVTGEGPPNG